MKYKFPSFMRFDGSQFSIIATDEESAMYYSDELKIKIHIKPIPYDAGKKE